MFCEKCGCQNSDDAKFCENCGAELRNNLLHQGERVQVTRLPMSGMPAAMPERLVSIQGNQVIQPQRRKSFSLLPAVLMAEAVILAVMIFFGVKMSQKWENPENVAESYFVNLVNGDWKAAYGQLNLPSSNDFLNSESFARVQAENNLGIVRQFQLRKSQEEADLQSGSTQDFRAYLAWQEENGIQNEESLDQETVVIDYQAQGDIDISSYTVPLQKNSGGWKVVSTDLVCQDYYIYVPVGASAYVDGIDLKDDYDIPEGHDTYIEGMRGYRIPYIFYGIHDVKVSMEGMEDVLETVRIEPGMSQYYLDIMPARKETMDELIELGWENLQKIYSAAMEGKNFTAIEELFITEEESRRDIQEAYEYLLSKIHEGGINIEKINFYNVSGEVPRGFNSVLLRFEYEMQYLEEDLWSGDMERETSEGSNEWQFYFAEESGEWVQTNLGCEPLY